MGNLDREERAISRRSFLKRASAFVILGAAGVGNWSALESLFKRSPALGKPASDGGQSEDGKDAPFTVFWITDTQYVSEKNSALYSRMTRWIADQWDGFNGKLLIHTGDVVQNGYFLREWVNADAAMKVLRDNGMPYLWCAGNHDDLVLDDPASGWAGSQFDSFNPAVVSREVNGTGYAQWAGDYHDGMNTAVAFSANGLGFLVVSLEWNAPEDVLDWFEGLLDDEQYKSYYVIVAPHAYEDAFGSTDDQRWGPTLKKFREQLCQIMDKHMSNVFLTLNGHFATDSGYHTSSPVNNRNQLMFDRQESTDDPKDPIDSSVTDELKVGGATVTLLTFDTSQNVVTVRTFDPFNGEYRANTMDQYVFTMFPSQLPQSHSPSRPLLLQRPRAG